MISWTITAVSTRSILHISDVVCKVKDGYRVQINCIN